MVEVKDVEYKDVESKTSENRVAFTKHRLCLKGKQSNKKMFTT